MTQPGLPEPVLRQRREQTIVALCEHFAQDRLGVEEFEARVDLAHRAATLADLELLTRDLPATASAPDAAPSAAPRPVRAGEIPETNTMLAIMGGVERRGHWTPARRTVVIALMGGAELDFRDVALPPGETQLHIFAMMGGVELIVPPELNIDANGVAIMGGFGHAAERQAPVPGAPVLRINGFCLMGGVDIQVRLPGESAGDAKRRRRELQRQRRRLKGGE